MCFPVFGHMKKTADNTDAGFQPAQLVAVLPAAKPASQPLWSCQNYYLNQKETPKRLRRVRVYSSLEQED